MSKPSRFPAIAGALAGLLAAGLGALYLYPGHVGRSPGVETKVGNRAVAPAPAGTRLNRDGAVQRLLALPELKAWSAQIEKDSDGAVHGAVIEYDPAPRLVNGKAYYQLSFVENGPDKAVPRQGFLVGAADGDILVEDDANDQLLSLDRWRAQRPSRQRDATR